MNNKSLDIARFLKLVIEALNAAGVEYLIGGAIAAWAWGEPRATQDLDLVVKIPIKSVNKLSKKLEKRDMLIPAEIIPRTSWKTGQISQSMRFTCTAGSGSNRNIPATSPQFSSQRKMNSTGRLFRVSAKRLFFCGRTGTRTPHLYFRQIRS